MSPWKVILATMVIFGCGVVTGGLLMRTVIPPAGIPAEVVPHILPATSTNQPPPLGQLQRPEFLRRIQKQLDLSPAQNEAIAKIMKDSQERTRKFWEQIGPQLREEFKGVRGDIRQVLTPEQRKKWDELLKIPRRKAEGSSAPSLRPPRAPNAESPTNTL